MMLEQPNHRAAVFHQAVRAVLRVVENLFAWDAERVVHGRDQVGRPYDLEHQACQHDPSRIQGGGTLSRRSDDHALLSLTSG